jgi:hypothetical protein
LNAIQALSQLSYRPVRDGSSIVNVRLATDLGPPRQSGAEERT